MSFLIITVNAEVKGEPREATAQFFSRNQELVLMIPFLAMVFGTSLPAPCSPSRISVCGPGTLTPTSMASHLTRAYGALAVFPPPASHLFPKSLLLPPSSCQLRHGCSLCLTFRLPSVTWIRLENSPFIQSFPSPSAPVSYYTVGLAS